MQDREQHFTLEELARLVGLSVRTIRYYITEGLLAGPGARGKAAVYGEGHLLKLRLIRRLSEQRMSLAEMQGLLPRLSLDEVRELLAEEDERAQELARSARKGTTPGEYLDTLLKNAQAARRISDPQPQGGLPEPARQKSLPSPVADILEEERVQSVTDWKRWELAPGVELHVRSDAEVQQRNLIGRIFKAAEAIFKPGNKW